jgi:hypothetical protein
MAIVLARALALSRGITSLPWAGRARRRARGKTMRRKRRLADIPTAMASRDAPAERITRRPLAVSAPR